MSVAAPLVLSAAGGTQVAPAPTRVPPTAPPTAEPHAQHGGTATPVAAQQPAAAPNPGLLACWGSR